MIDCLCSLLRLIDYSVRCNIFSRENLIISGKWIVSYLENEYKLRNLAGSNLFPMCRFKFNCARSFLSQAIKCYPNKYNKLPFSLKTSEIRVQTNMWRTEWLKHRPVFLRNSSSFSLLCHLKQNRCKYSCDRYSKSLLIKCMWLSWPWVW